MSAGTHDAEFSLLPKGWMERARPKGNIEKVATAAAGLMPDRASSTTQQRGACDTKSSHSLPVGERQAPIRARNSTRAQLGKGRCAFASSDTIASFLVGLWCTALPGKRHVHVRTCASPSSKRLALFQGGVSSSRVRATARLYLI